MKIKPFFEECPVFRYEEFANYMMANGTTRPESWRQLLNYHLKAGHLIHIRKSLYAVRPIFYPNIIIDPYTIACKATNDSIIAYHSALEFHGIAYTTFSEFTILTSHSFQPFMFDGNRFRAIKKAAALLDANNPACCIEIVQRAGMDLKVTNLERTLVDILDRPDLAGGWEEIGRSFDNITRLNIKKLVAYTLLLKNATTVSKVGFFLEQLPEYLSIDKKHIDELLPYIPKQPHYLNRDQRQGGKYIEKWRLIVPDSIINRSWEEPNVENI